MRQTRADGGLERGAVSDLWRNTLSQIPSVFGRQVYLTSLRDANTGRYEHHGMALVFGEDEADRALRQSHEEVFRQWLSFDLQRQKTDLDLYLAEVASQKRTVVSTWARLKPYRNLAPASAREEEIQLYLADLEILLELLRNEYGVGVTDPDA